MVPHERIRIGEADQPLSVVLKRAGIEMEKVESRLEANSILFVCYGNACRSPMAEGLAKKALGSRIRVESAGLAPIFDGAAQLAILTMKDHYGIDISDHIAKNITDMPLREFDLIIILDAYVWNTVRKLAPDLGDKLLLWDIRDPYGSNLAVYRRVAVEIWDNIQKYLV